MKSANPNYYNLDNSKRPPRHMGTPGVPMVYAPMKLDTTFSDELACRLAREYTHECIDSLVEHMRDRSNPQASLVATQALLDRAYGKSKEVKNLNGPDENGGLPKYRIKVEFVDVIDTKPQAPKSEAPVEPIFEETNS